MPRICRECDNTVEPIAQQFARGSSSGYFLTCPVCHFVFSKVDSDWFDESEYA